MPMNDATVPAAYRPLAPTNAPVPVLPAIRYPVIAAECPVAPGTVTTASRSVRSVVAFCALSTGWVAAGGHAVTVPSGLITDLIRRGVMYVPLLAITVYAAAICSGVVETPSPIGIVPNAE